MTLFDFTGPLAEAVMAGITLFYPVIILWLVSFLVASIFLAVMMGFFAFTRRPIS